MVQAVILAEGRDADDRELQLTTAHRIGNMMQRLQRRKAVEPVGRRSNSTLWRLVG